MSIQWSEKQQAVIDARGCSVLVSAAAGSGKTAVLVERLIRLLTDEKHPVDIERLLVVTFTNAAAAEMRERIGRGLDQKLLEEPDHTAWIRQKLLLPCAQISTIHSLCLKTIREHFEVLDLDPSFRLGDEAELKLLKSDVAEDVMETYYASENRAFRAFVDRYANGKTDQGIAEMIIALYDYSRGFPWPEYWLKHCLAAYSTDEDHNGADQVKEFAMMQLHNVLTKYLPLFEEARAHNPDIVLLDLGLPDMEGVEVIKKIRTWSTLPIIVVSARSEDTDKIEALDAGADDYITKPFSVEELLARIRVAQRRLSVNQGIDGKESAVFTNGELKIDYTAGCVFLRGEELHLTPIEYKLLCLLSRNMGKVLTHTYITQQVWGRSSENDVASLRVFMATLRKKLEADKKEVQYIQTHIGIGYRMLKIE